MLLIAGDLFHRQPLLRELKEVDYLFSTLSKTQVALVAGNHDYVRENSYYRSFGWSPNVHMILSGDVTCLELQELDTAIYGLSYYERERRDLAYEQVAPGDKCRYRILLAHGGDDRHLPFRREVVASLGFDYVALGHIHKPQILVQDRMAYAGALEPVDKNDTGPHGYIQGELEGKKCRISFIPMARREYIHMEIPIHEETTGFGLRSQILEAIGKRGVENIYRLRIEGFRDPEISFDLDYMDSCGNIIEILDNTKPAYDFMKLLGRNRENLLGKYIESFQGALPGSVEYEALCAGVKALMETKRG